MKKNLINSHNFKISLSSNDDYHKICSIDTIQKDEQERRQLILKSLNDKILYSAYNNNQILGYIILEHSFFNRGFISMLFVEHYHRRYGIGSVLIQYVEGLCKSDRIFTSTNLSNTPMQKLLKKLGYNYSGIVQDLDLDDPELFYSKKILLK